MPYGYRDNKRELIYLLVEAILGIAFLSLFVFTFTRFQGGAYKEIIKYGEIYPDYWEREYPAGIFDEIIASGIYFSASLGCFIRAAMRSKATKWICFLLPIIYPAIFVAVGGDCSLIGFWGNMPWMVISLVFCSVVSFVSSLVLASYSSDRELPLWAYIIIALVITIFPVVAYLQNWILIIAGIYLLFLLTGHEPTTLIIIIIIERG